MEFEWDAEKAKTNVDRHGVAFAEALTVFGDPLEVTVADPDHSVGECRFLSVGMSSRGRMLVVSYVEPTGDRIRSSVRDQLRRGNGGNLKRGPDEYTMRSEYDFSSGVRGKHYEAYRRGTNVILLEPDVAAVFKDSAAVNAALRALAQVAHAHTPAATDQ